MVDYYPNTGNRWSKEDEQYLNDWYYIAGPEELSYALGRTVNSITQKIKNNGLKKPKARVFITEGNEELRFDTMRSASKYLGKYNDYINLKRRQVGNEFRLDNKVIKVIVC